MFLVLSCDVIQVYIWTEETSKRHSGVVCGGFASLLVWVSCSYVGHIMSRVHVRVQGSTSHNVSLAGLQEEEMSSTELRPAQVPPRPPPHRGPGAPLIPACVYNVCVLESGHMTELERCGLSGVHLSHRKLTPSRVSVEHSFHSPP